MKDFFISYNKANRDWAQWVAWTLEQAGYTVVFQAWDFQPGANFVLEMQKATVGTRRTIVMLSNAYLSAEYTHSEWAAAFARDPKGDSRLLVPIRIEHCLPQGLLAQIIYLDIVGLLEEDAKAAILGAFSQRVKPTIAPDFPGTSRRPKNQRVVPQPVPYPSAIKIK